MYHIREAPGRYSHQVDFRSTFAGVQAEYALDMLMIDAGACDEIPNTSAQEW